MPLEMADAAATAKEIKQMLLDAAPLSYDLSKPLLPNYDRVTSKAMVKVLTLLSEEYSACMHAKSFR